MAMINRANLAVLVVDDQMIARNHVKQNLVSMGFADIDIAATSAEAEEKIAAKNYDIIFCDWHMPGKSGFAMMQAFRQEREFDHVAFVMVTAESEERHMVEALKAGATSYILKPILPQPFQAKVENVLQWIAKVNPRYKCIP